jgi:uncharacterized protein
MFIRPKDYISVDDKLFFAVVSEYQEDDRALTWLRYIKDDNVMKKLSTRQADELVKKSCPELYFHSHYADSDLHGVPLEKIDKVYRPDQTVTRLINSPTLDEKQKDAVNLVKQFLTTGIKQESIGITGSLMLDTHNDQSDIDIVIYGRDNFFEVRELIKKKIESGELKSLDEFLWQEAYKRRDCEITYEEYKSHELRKYNKCVSGKTKVDISMIPEVFERFHENGPYKKIGQDKIQAVVDEDTYAYDFPARYLIDNEIITEVVSYTATYIGQAVKGETIEAAGYIEQGINGKNRLLVGTSREAAGEYIRVIP